MRSDLFAEWQVGEIPASLIVPVSVKFAKYRTRRTQFINLPILDELRNRFLSFRFDNLHNCTVFRGAAAIATSPDPSVRSNIADKKSTPPAHVAKSTRMIMRVQYGGGKLAADFS